MQRLADELKEEPKCLLHYDGKKFDESGTPIERLPVALSGFKSGDDYLLKTPTVCDGKAKTYLKRSMMSAAKLAFLTMLLAR